MHSLSDTRFLLFCLPQEFAGGLAVESAQVAPSPIQPKSWQLGDGLNVIVRARTRTKASILCTSRAVCQGAQNLEGSVIHDQAIAHSFGRLGVVNLLGSQPSLVIIVGPRIGIHVGQRTPQGLHHTLLVDKVPPHAQPPIRLHIPLLHCRQVGHSTTHQVSESQLL